MEMPQEIEVWYVIPAIRRELAKNMKSKGMKQTEIAKRMGMTKSAITQYLNNKRANNFNFNEGTEKEIQEASTRINNSLDTIREIQHILSLIRNESMICELHKNMDKSLPNKCDVCFVHNKLEVVN